MSACREIAVRLVFNPSICILSIKNHVLYADLYPAIMIVFYCFAIAIARAGTPQRNLLEKSILVTCGS